LLGDVCIYIAGGQHVGTNLTTSGFSGIAGDEWKNFRGFKQADAEGISVARDFAAESWALPFARVPFGDDLGLS
jgi:hypothetical protein